MHVGDLRQRITIQQLGSGQDTDGSPNGTWTDFATVWAEVKPLSGREKLAAQQVEAEVTHAVTIRYCAGVVPKMKILFGAREFNIRNVLNTDEQNVEMRILATEKV